MPNTLRNSDAILLAQALQWSKAQADPYIVTVSQTWGSAPRPPGSLFVMTANGHYCGSVSGGCIEQDLVTRCQQGEWQTLTQPQLLSYGVTPLEAARFGLPCGGRLELVIERVAGNADWHSLVEALQAGQLVARQLNWATGQSQLIPITNPTTPAFSLDNQLLRKVFGTQWRMLLIGANQLAYYVTQFALALDYEVLVCDPRTEGEYVWTLPTVPILRLMPDDAVAHLQHYQRSIILTLSHDPKLDDMALMTALNTDAFYVGALGSKTSSAKRRERLRQLDISEANLNKLHAPVGLALGSRTPAEIAIAILADLTARRNTYASA
jgi:xanthine dehydrogenase accessory factor